MTRVELAAESSWFEDCLREAAVQLGLDCNDRRLLRIGHCAIFHLPRHGLVARAARLGASAECLETELVLARLLHRRGFPVVSPANAIAERPVATATGAVTFWPFLESTGSEVDWRSLGDIFRRMHACEPLAGMPSLWDPVGRTEARIARYRANAGVRAGWMEVLTAACASAKRIIGRRAVESRIIHGDPTNIIMTANGPVLIDFDLTGLGPPAWDIVSVVVRHRRFGLPREHLDAFRAAYGSGYPPSAVIDDLVAVRELLDCSFALDRLASGDAGADREVEIRLRALTDPRDRSRWTPMGEIRSASTSKSAPETSGAAARLRRAQ